MIQEDQAARPLIDYLNAVLFNPSVAETVGIGNLGLADFPEPTGDRHEQIQMHLSDTQDQQKEDNTHPLADLILQHYARSVPYTLVQQYFFSLVCLP